MNTLSELVTEMSKGAMCIHGQVMIDKPYPYSAKCYRVGKIIRIDLELEEPKHPPQGKTTPPA